MLQEKKDESVKGKYGFVPTSVLYFVKDNKLTLGYLEDQSLRKSKEEDSSSASMSEFNNELCEFIIKYWTNKGDIVVDPFHGWGTRAAITNQLKRQYVGFDISPSTSANVKRLIEGQQSKTNWFGKEQTSIQLHCADGIKLEGIPNDYADLVFSCPPYFNIEKYEDVPGQLTNINNYDLFLQKMEEGARRYWQVLKPGKFCIMVVGDWRVDGVLRMFSTDMINIYRKVGFKMHDFLIHKLNSAAVVGCGNFEHHKFVTKSHEYVLVFRK